MHYALWETKSIEISIKNKFVSQAFLNKTTRGTNSHFRGRRNRAPSGPAEPAEGTSGKGFGEAEP